MKKLCYFGGSFLNFKWIKYLSKGLSHLKNGGIGVTYCWNCGPWKWLLHFNEYLLDQLNNKHMKTAINLTMQFFESRYQKKYLVKVWSFFCPPTTKCRPSKFLVKLSRNHLLIANIFELHKYHTFGLLKMHNMSKIWFANE